MEAPGPSLLLLSLFAGQVLSKCSPIGTVKTYYPSDDSTVLMNPERGFYGDFYSFSSAVSPVAFSDLQSLWKNDKVTVVLVDYTMDTFLTSNISSIFLSTMQNDMNTVRAVGMKAALRFSYTQSEGNYNDATITQLLNHIAQVKPLLQNNADVIFVLQAGFIGTWGEWYYSKNYATMQSDGSFIPTAAQQANRMKIIGALLNALPASRMLQLRTPDFKMQYCNTTANLASSQAYNSANACSRIGIHNDCFMASWQDAGTFDDNSQRTWLFNEGQYVMTGGESCEKNANTACTPAQNQILQQRITYLNKDYHDQVISSWKTAGCYNKIANMMGYRFQLISETFPSQVTRGTTYCATISVKNTGVTNLMNARPIQVLLRNKKTGTLSTAFPITTDPRFWFPNATVSFDLSFTVPTTLGAGLHDVLLNLPDASSTLSNNANYRVVLANTGVAEATTRYNILNQVNLI